MSIILSGDPAVWTAVCDDCGESFTDFNEFAYGHDCEAK